MRIPFFLLLVSILIFGCVTTAQKTKAVKQETTPATPVAPPAPVGPAKPKAVPIQLPPPPPPMQELEPAPPANVEYEYESAPAPAPTVDQAFNEARFIRFAAQQYGIEIEKIYFGHNKTGITAVLVNVIKNQEETALTEMQAHLNELFYDYRSAILHTIVRVDGAPVAVIRSKKNYDIEKRWTVVYDYETSMDILRQKRDEFEAAMPNITSLSGHELTGVYYPLHGFSNDKGSFPSSLIAFTKDADGNYYRFNIYGTKAGDLWNYRLADDRYYSTDDRSDPQIQFILDNGDIVSLSLYYFEETDERYGSYFLQVK